MDVHEPIINLFPEGPAPRRYLGQLVIGTHHPQKIREAAPAALVTLSASAPICNKCALRGIAGFPGLDIRVPNRKPRCHWLLVYAAWFELQGKSLHIYGLQYAGTTSPQPRGSVIHEAHFEYVVHLDVDVDLQPVCFVVSLTVDVTEKAPIPLDSVRGKAIALSLKGIAHEPFSVGNSRAVQVEFVFG